jgi:hypothetical protein
MAQMHQQRKNWMALPAQCARVTLDLKNVKLVSKHLIADL